VAATSVGSAGREARNLLAEAIRFDLVLTLEILAI
jgi:hypothetical protein